MACELGAQHDNIILFASHWSKNPDLSQLVYGISLATRGCFRIGHITQFGPREGEESLLEDSRGTYLIPEIYVKK